MVDDALDIASVPSEKGTSVSLFGRIRRRIVRRITVGETVRHDKVDHVRRGKTSTLCRASRPPVYTVRVFESLFSVGEYEPVIPCYGVRSDSHVNENIIRTVALMYLLDFDTTAAFHLHIESGNAVSVYHDLERGFHPHPPRKGLDPLHLVSGIGGDGRVESGTASA